MDFGIIYIQNKAAANAAMWLGMTVFLLAIFIPYVGAYLFIPLYIAVLIKLAYYKFQVDGLWSAILLPFAPFAFSILLCILFWWAIPSVVNIADELITLFRPGTLSLYRETIPDDKCFLYFVLVIGGGIGSLFCLLVLFLGMERISATSYNYSESLIKKTYMITGALIAEEFCPTTKDIVSDYKNNSINSGEANYRIKKRFKQWVMEKCDITSNEAEYLWNSKKWLMEIK